MLASAYAELIYMPRPVSNRRKMEVGHRAKQFAPFPFYFLTRNVIGMSNAATVMVLLMLPAFMFAIIFG